MNCKTAQYQIALAVGEDLSPAESQELQGHLQACSNCQKTWEQHQQGFAVLQRSRIQEIRPESDSFWPVLANRLRERAADSPRGEFNGWFAALAVTAACVLVFVFSQEGLVPLPLQPRSGNTTNSTMASDRHNSEERTPSLLQRDDVQTKRVYNPARRP